MSETGETAGAGLVGDKPYQEHARSALPILVRQSKARRPIVFGELAAELGIRNARTLGWPLGAIGNTMLTLGERWGARVPPIEALVVNKDTGLPAQSIYWFASDSDECRDSSPTRRKEIVDLLLLEVYEFDRWDEVLEACGLTPLPPLSDLAS